MTQKADSMSETRLNVRLAVYYGPDKPTLMTDYSINMSIGGIFIETEKILPVETPLHVKFMLPVEERLISCKARVAWVNDPRSIIKPSLPPGMGIQFLDISLEDVQTIRKFLEKYSFKPVW